MSEKKPAQEDPLLIIRYENLEEDYESRKKDLASAKLMLENLRRTNEEMKAHLEKQTKEPEAKKRQLIKELETEKEEKMKIVAELKRVEDEMRNIDQKVLVAEEEGVTKLKKMEDTYNELAERSGAIETKISHVKSLFEAEGVTNNVTESLVGEGVDNVAGDDEVIVVEEYRNVNNIVTDVVEISDDSDDGGYDNAPRETNVIPQVHVGITKEEGEGSSGATQSTRQVKYPSPSSSSSSTSSDEFVLVPLSVKKSG